MRRCFFDGLKRKGNKYYLHDHLDFLLENDIKKSKRSSAIIYNDETSSNLSDSLQKTDDNTVKLKERAPKSFKIFDEDDIKSYGSQTTSADESNDILPQTAGVFIINELEDDETYQPDIELEGDRRLSFNRSCKRALDPQLINELADEESEPKRQRKSEKLSNNKLCPARIEKTKTVSHTAESVKIKSMEISAETKLGKDIGVQCGVSVTDFDDMFMQSIKTQLQQMNGRQKMNFKRKIYQSLLEVFDDANDFPDSNETSSTPNKQPPSVVNTTVGELRLMRELVSLVQAAKNTPEIMNAKEKQKTSTPVPSKTSPKMPAPIAENRLKRSRSPLTISPTPDDDDLQFFVDDSEDEEIPLPRSWDEIKAKTGETSKATPQENSIGLTRRILQKVVRVSGSSGGTIVARDGDKKRIYRIVPKQINPNGNNGTQTKNDTSGGRIIATKAVQDPRKDGSVGTFYVANAKNPQDISKSNISAPGLTIRSFNSKTLNNSQPAAVSSSNSNQHTSSNTNYNNTNGQTIFKGVHPTNRILSSSTGYFKMIPTAKPITSSPNQKPTSQNTATAATNPSVSKVMTAKLPLSSMLPPTTNVTTKRIQAVRAPPILQRRYSICGPLPAEKQNTMASTNSAKIGTPTNNGKAQAQPVSQIQMSHPVSLNSRTASSPTVSNTISSNNTQTSTSSHTPKPLEPPTSKDTKISIKPIENPKESVKAKDPMAQTTILQREVPILETAGTVEADDLDPLFVKAPHIKAEPVDDD